MHKLRHHFASVSIASTFLIPKNYFIFVDLAFHKFQFFWRIAKMPFVDGSKDAESCLKKANLLILPPRDAVPFSDEWLAAMEAAGEVISFLENELYTVIYWSQT